MSQLAFVMQLVLLTWMAATSHAQVSGEAARYVNPMGELLPWVAIPQIEKELDILADQKEKLTRLRTDATKDMRELYAAANDGDRETWRERYNELSAKMAADLDRQTRDVLLPHQVRRLRQIALQMKLSSTGYGSAGGLTGGEVADELHLTDEQKRQLKEKEAKLREDIQRKTQEFYKQLREEARAELLSVLTAEQRRKLDDLTGETFEWQRQQPSQGKPQGDQKSTE